MPKNNKVTKGQGGVLKKQRVASKSRIGNRKTGKSANLFSTADLEAVLVDPNKKKFYNKARNVLAQRA